MNIDLKLCLFADIGTVAGLGRKSARGGAGRQPCRKDSGH